MSDNFKLNKIDDNEILRLFRDKKSEKVAFEHLVNNYKKILYHHIRRIVENHDDTDDVLQNTFIKIYENIKFFREDSKLYTWIYRIATNEALNFIKNKKVRNLYINTISEKYSEQQTEIQSIDGENIQKILKFAIDQLPEKQKIVFYLRYYEELKYEDISEILGTSVGALKASYHIAVKKIEEILTRN